MRNFKKDFFLHRSKQNVFPAEWYEFAKEEHFWCQWRFTIFLQQIEALGIDKNAALKGLDVGCGNGVVRRQIEKNMNWIVDGADLSEETLHFNHTTRGKTFLYNVHERHPEFKEAYDFVILFDLLEHIQNTQQFIESVLYHLKPEGWIFINVPAIKELFSRYDVVAYHYRRYDKKMMQESLRIDGVKIHDIRYWGLSLLPLILLRVLFLLKYTSAETILKKGFKMPNKFSNKILLKLMHAETALIKKPILGSSLMTAAMKLSAPKESGKP